MCKVIETLKSLYSDKDAAIKHVILFVFAGVMSILTTMSDMHKSPDPLVLISAIVFTILISVFLSGYSFKFLHNIYHKDETQKTLPDFDKTSFNIFFNALPLMLAWVLYYIIFCLFILIPVAGLLFFAFVMFLTPFLSFIFIAYAKDYNKDGLFDITIIFKYIKNTLGSIIILGLKFLVVWIAAMAIIFILGIIAGITGMVNPKDSSIAIYLSSTFGGYLGIIIQFAWLACLVDVYKKHVEKSDELPQV